MKGQRQVTEFFSTIGLIVVFIALIPLILPTIQEALKLFSLDSPEVVSKDLANLLSISNAAQDYILIEYNTDSGNSYNIDIKDGMLTAWRELNGEKQESSTPILINAKGSFSDVKDFTIEKRVENGIKKILINGMVIFSTDSSPPQPTPGPEPGPDPEPNPPIIPSPDMCPGSFFEVTPIDCGPGKVDLLEYYIPDFAITNVIQHSSGHVEYFHTYLTDYNDNEGFFYITKSRDPIYFEEFKFDKNSIYHMKDTTWATGPSQNVKCDNGDDAYFTLINGNYGKDNCGAYNPGIEGGTLHPRCMSVGEITELYQLTVVGFSKRSCQCCKTPYTGNLPESITFVSKGKVTFLTGWSGDDVVKLYKSTTQETYYYDKQLGWVGFEGPGFHAYIKETLPEARCAQLSCVI